jgi:ribonuclease-3
MNLDYIRQLSKKYSVPLSDKIKYNIPLFKEALQHASLQKLDPNVRSYERLEYLGDALFHLIVTDYLYHRYDSESEGFLTKLRISLERGDSLVQLTKVIGLDRFICLYQINLNDHILEDVFESFVGAYYLNMGFDSTKSLMINLIESHKDFAAMISDDKNYKDLLLRYFHQMKWGHPIYHTSKDYVENKFVRYVMDNETNLLGKAVANSKARAEQLASKFALIKLGIIVNDEIDQQWLDKIDHVDEPVDERKVRNDISVFNRNNILITRKAIKKIFSKYNIPLDAIQAKSINKKLFYESTTHRTYLVRTTLTPLDELEAEHSVALQPTSNERLRFLGGTVIHFVLGEYLYNTYDRDEGFLTRLRSKLENKESLFDLSNRTGIASYVLMSQGMEIMHGRKNVNIIFGGFEAFIGAVYLNFDLHMARKLFINIITTEFDINAIIDSETNYKEQLMHYYNSHRLGIPDYRLIQEEGPDNAKIFTIGIFVNDILFAGCVGVGASKKKAEQEAAKLILIQYATSIRHPKKSQ